MLSSRFRWVYCQLERLCRCLPSSVRLILDELPATLDETYARILREIADENRLHTHRLLHCLTVAARPLRVEELSEVLVIDFAVQGTPKLNVNLRWEDQEEAILLACSSLVTVIDDNGFRVVQFSHFSVKEFLTSGRLAESQGASHYHILPEAAHTVMAQACLAVLLQLDYDTDMESMKNFPLANYAATHFGNHAEFRNVISHIRDGIDALLDAEKPHFSAWLWTRNLADGRSWTTCPEPLDELPLYHVVEFGFVGLVRHLISKRPQDVTANSRYTYRVLLRAVHNGHAKVSQLLLQYCPDVNTRVDHSTLLHSASISGCVDIGQQLIDRGADINARVVGKRTPLHLALERGQVNFARMLIDRNVDILAVNRSGKTPLHVASWLGHCNIMKLLLDKGVEVDAKSKQRRTPLHEALRGREPEAAQLLLESGANVRTRDEEGKTALHFVSGWGNLDIMRLLLDQGSEVDTRDKSLSTPLHHASRSGQLAAARMLLESGAKVCIRDKEGKTALHVASERENLDMLRLLLDRGSEGDALDESLSTRLHHTLRSKQPAPPGLQLESRPNVRIRDKERKTALHLASEWGNPDIMRLLLDQGSEVDAQDKSHSTPLHRAVQRWKPEAARLLLESGANVRTRDKDGRTALHFASELGNLDIMRL
jgi:ankyrin repeat protein